MIFVNLPVTDLAASRAFYTALGFSIDEQFSDDASASVVVSDAIHLQLLSHARFADFLPGGTATADPRTATAALYALSCDSREEVDAMVGKAMGAGGGTWKPAQDHGFMYGASFTDPDGHVWEVLWMDPASAQ
ncbi:VOC family protein [Geodermatophilus bullaregiensis]|uniref:VOC family protein n=1 Tax=Geodermatophilus bullaregiensis TaxID=1564160 RepID=UPI001EF84D22|nr:VOC family protein [Geodermatophilus bullaregiensis]